MDLEQARRRQSRRVIISEALMTLSVIITVIALAFIVSGYWVNSDFEIERQGLLQISSTPTGADVIIDGDTSWLQRTNTSKVLKSGEHQISLTKEGYDSWSKTINISEGLLYRIRYPRLFLKERQKEVVLTESGITDATVSPANDKMLLLNETTTWALLSLDSEPIKSKPLNVTNLFQNTDGNVLTAKIASLDWSSDSSHVLIHAVSDSLSEWVLLDINKPENSLSLTKAFDASFDQIVILDGSATNLLVLRGSNLHKINTSSKSISAVLASDVTSFDYYRNMVVLSRQKPEVTLDSEKVESTEQVEPTDTAESSEIEPQYEVALLDLSNEKTTTLHAEPTPTLVNISRFYDDVIITVVSSDKVSLYKKDDVESLLKAYDLSFNPDKIKNSYESEFIVMSNGQQIATIDMEASAMLEWSTDGASHGWLQDDMLYSVNDGKLYVYDADGLNRRMISENVSSRFPITITKNKWLYYFSDGSLIKEKIAN